MEATGAASLEFLSPFLSQLANAGSTGPKVDQAGINFMLSVVKGIAPRDQLEAMLAAQMAAIHMSSMTMVRRLNGADTLAQQDGAERALNKLTRTFAIQLDALKRYRSTGQQKVTVEHVTVNAGGQAIVGSVEGGRPPQKTREQPHAKQLPHAPVPSMFGHVEAVEEPLPVARGRGS